MIDADKLDRASKRAAEQVKATRFALNEAKAALADQRTARRLEAIYASRPKQRRKDDLIRVIIPDSHGAHIARHAAAAMLGDIKGLDPHEIVMLGDHLDCGGFLAQHHTMGYVAETETSYADDAKQTNALLDQIQKAAPRATIHYLEGNHESRVEKWCVTSSLRNRADAQDLLDVWGPCARLHLKARGISYYRTSGRYHGLPVPGTIRLGKCAFTHGISFSTHASHVHASRFGLSVVFGHTHRSQSTIIRTVGGGVIGAWCPGCLCQLQPLYEATRPTDWTHGYAVQVVAKSGEFMHIQVPIINGRSMLMRLPGGKP